MYIYTDKTSLRLIGRIGGAFQTSLLMSAENGFTAGSQRTHIGLTTDSLRVHNRFTTDSQRTYNGFTADLQRICIDSQRVHKSISTDSR